MARATSYLGNSLFVVLLGCCMVLLTWLSHRNELQWDLTAARIHSLSPDGQKLIRLVEQKLSILAFAGDHATQQDIQNFINLYSKHTDKIELRFIDPWQRPDEVNRYKITTSGELVLLYGGQQTSINPQHGGGASPLFQERQFNAVLQRLLRSQEQLIYFIEGHGERPVDGNTNHGLSTWAGLLRKRGFAAASYVVTANETIPANASLVVLTMPQLDWLLPELLVMREYIERGGALLWLADPGPSYGMEPLSQLLGISFGTEELQAARLLPGSGDTTLLSPELGSYSNHPVMREFRFRTLFPQTVPVIVNDDNNDWKYTPLVKTGSEQEAVALTMTRTVNGTQQRVAVFGDGDFLSNAFILNGGNNELGTRLTDWLTGNDNLVATLEDDTLDVTVEMSEVERSSFALFYLAGLPIVLLVLAWFVHIRRRV